LLVRSSDGLIKLMDTATAEKLIEINRRFYSQFGAAFSATRRRVQPGVRRILAGLPDEGDWLDVGCGNGSLALEWLEHGRVSGYTGLDFSTELLDEARRAVGAWQARSDQPVGRGSIRFVQADLTRPGWDHGLAPGGLRGALAFAVLHHIPSVEMRSRLLSELRGMLAPGGVLIHSVWQYQHSPKWMARRLPWSVAGLDEAGLEPGDTLLDWRFSLPGQAEQTGLRYVHLFSREELAWLAAGCGYRIVDEFESDGAGGCLGLYQTWQVV